MSAIIFFPQQGGYIPFQFDTKKFYACAISGTSVTLSHEEIVYVTKGFEVCSEEQVLGCTRAAIELSDEQPYANGRCWTTVRLFDKRTVDNAVPAGFEPAIVTFQYGMYHVKSFLGLKRRPKFKYEIWTIGSVYKKEISPRLLATPKSLKDCGDILGLTPGKVRERMWIAPLDWGFDWTFEKYHVKDDLTYQIRRVVVSE